MGYQDWQYTKHSIATGVIVSQEYYEILSCSLRTLEPFLTKISRNLSRSWVQFLSILWTVAVDRCATPVGVMHDQMHNVAFQYPMILDMAPAIIYFQAECEIKRLHWLADTLILMLRAQENIWLIVGSSGKNLQLLIAMWVNHVYAVMSCFKHILTSSPEHELTCEILRLGQQALPYISERFDFHRFYFVRITTNWVGGPHDICQQYNMK